MLIERPEKPRPPRRPPSGPKPALPMFQLPIFRVKMADFESYLRKVYRTEEFDFLVAAGIVEGECPEYTVQAALPAASEYVRKAEDVRNGRRTRNVPLVLNVLCIDGYIPAGKYIIDSHPQPRSIDVYTSLIKTRLDPDDPDCVAFKNARLDDRLFMSQAATLDKMVTEAVQAEKDLLKRRQPAS